MTDNSDPVQRYAESTPQSRELYRRACDVMPGGNTREAVYFDPYPAYVDRGNGCHVVDCDGNEYLDFVNNMTSLVHGHAHEGCEAAAIDAIRASSAPGGPTSHEVEWAEHLVGRIDVIDDIRFTNSGTEATMNAIRAARAYTGKDRVAKFEGTYHGTHDDAQISVHPPSSLSGPIDSPNSVPDSAGVPSSKRRDVLTLPFNDPDAAVSRLEATADDLACVIIAPFMGSMVVPATDEFVREIAAFTSRHDIPLIFDEVIAFRHAYGGAHATYDVEPDLVALGKAIGGGFPVGAFGGREELMAGYDPRGGAKIVHSGTFNANPVTAAAGLAALEEYTAEEVRRLNRLGNALAEGCRDIVRDRGVAIEVNQVGSLFNLYPTTGPVENYRDAARSVADIERQLFFELLDRDVRVVPKLMGSLSTPMDESDVTAFVEALDAALGSTRPLFELHGLTR